MFIDFLDRVSKVCAPRFNNLRFQVQVLTQSCLDDKRRQRSLLLLSKICKARNILPSSYLLKQKFIHVGRASYHGGFAEVSNGEYLGNPVAIKSLNMNEEDSGRTFKVPSINFICHPCPTFSSGYVERSLVGSICLIRTSCRCWEFPCPQTPSTSVSSPNGCPMVT